MAQQGMIVCHRSHLMVCTNCDDLQKGTDQIRLCVDLLRLNHYVCGEKYQPPTPVKAVADVAAEEAKLFTVLDARKGYTYHHCLLHEKS